MITLGAALEAFIREHEYCGELDTGLEGEVPSDTERIRTLEAGCPPARQHKLGDARMN